MPVNGVQLALLAIQLSVIAAPRCKHLPLVFVVEPCSSIVCSHNGAVSGCTATRHSATRVGCDRHVSPCWLTISATFCAVAARQASHCIALSADLQPLKSCRQEAKKLWQGRDMGQWRSINSILQSSYTGQHRSRTAQQRHHPVLLATSPSLEALCQLGPPFGPVICPGQTCSASLPRTGQ